MQKYKATNMRYETYINNVQDHTFSVVKYIGDLVIVRTNGGNVLALNII